MEKSINVVCGVISDQGKVLIARRASGKVLQGFWEFPGGKIEQGESPERALIRELQEEFSIQISVGEYIGESSHKYDFAEIHLQCYWAQKIGGDFDLKDHDELAWVWPSDLKQYKLAPADVPLVDLIENSNFQVL